MSLKDKNADVTGGSRCLGLGHLDVCNQVNGHCPYLCFGIASLRNGRFLGQPAAVTNGPASAMLDTASGIEEASDGSIRAR